MPRFVWLTDPHLNFLLPEEVEAFLDQVASLDPAGVLLTGDVGEARTVCSYLRQIARRLPCPIYFVLGNHDFYFGSLQAVRAEVSQLCQEVSTLHYLTHEVARPLTPHIGMMGHDGWADARFGNYERSLVMMNDYRLIAELAEPLAGESQPRHISEKAARWPLLQALGDEAAAHVRQVLPTALDRWSQVYLLTHVPPFREACWHEGRLSDDEWLPHFTCQAVGEALLEIMAARPDRQLTVLCGHTHGHGEAQLLPNLRVLTGGARYGEPEVQRVFELE